VRSSSRVLTIVVAGLALMGAGGAPHGVRYGLALAPGDPAPKIDLPNLTGDLILHAYADHPLTVVNFWATWCKPCREEMPALQRMSDKHRDGGLAVIGLLFDPKTDNEGARHYLDELGVRYPTMRTTLDTLRTWGGIGLFPTTFLIDREGKILRRYVGASPAQIDGMMEDVDAALAGRPLGSMVMPEPAPLKREDAP